MLTSADPKTGELLSDANVRYQILTFLIAGHETTAGLLALALEVTDDNWLMKTRAGAPGDPGSEVSVWCGVIPLAMTAGQPLAAPWAVGPVPTSVTDFVAARPAP